MRRSRNRKPRGVFTFLIFVFVLSAGLAGLAVIGGGVAFYATSTSQELLESESDGLAPGAYVRFSLYAEDFLLVENGAATVSTILDIHEANDVPVDVFVTAPVIRAYQASSPELVERLRTSSMVSVAYSVRPPLPHYTNFDYAGLAALEGDALTEALRSYESRQIDLVSGELQDGAGGFVFVKNTLGDIPAISLSDARGFEAALGALMTEFGVAFAGLSGEWGIEETIFGLSALPQHEVVNVSELRGQQAMVVLEQSVDRLDSEIPGFVHFEVTDSAFYVARPAWEYVYYLDVEQKIPAQPPFDLGAYQGNVTFQAPDVQESLFDVYRSIVEEVASQEDLTALNVQGLMEALDS